jgi:chromosome segregation ATPase
MSSSGGDNVSTTTTTEGEWVTTTTTYYEDEVASGTTESGSSAAGAPPNQFNRDQLADMLEGSESAMSSMFTSESGGAAVVASRYAAVAEFAMQLDAYSKKLKADYDVMEQKWLTAVEQSSADAKRWQKVVDEKNTTILAEKEAHNNTKSQLEVTSKVNVQCEKLQEEKAGLQKEVEELEIQCHRTTYLAEQITSLEKAFAGAKNERDNAVIDKGRALAREADLMSTVRKNELEIVASQRDGAELIEERDRLSHLVKQWATKCTQQQEDMRGHKLAAVHAQEEVAKLRATHTIAMDKHKVQASSEIALKLETLTKRNNSSYEEITQLKEDVDQSRKITSELGSRLKRAQDSNTRSTKDAAATKVKTLRLEERLVKSDNALVKSKAETEKARSEKRTLQDTVKQHLAALTALRLALKQQKLEQKQNIVSPLMQQVLQLRKHHPASDEFGSDSFLGDDVFAGTKAKLIQDGFDMPDEAASLDIDEDEDSDDDRDEDSDSEDDDFDFDLDEDNGGDSSAAPGSMDDMMLGVSVPSVDRSVDTVMQNQVNKVMKAAQSTGKADKRKKAKVDAVGEFVYQLDAYSRKQENLKDAATKELDDVKKQMTRQKQQHDSSLHMEEYAHLETKQLLSQKATVETRMSQVQMENAKLTSKLDEMDLKMTRMSTMLDGSTDLLATRDNAKKERDAAMIDRSEAISQVEKVKAALGVEIERVSMLSRDKTELETEKAKMQQKLNTWLKKTEGLQRELRECKISLQISQTETSKLQASGGVAARAALEQQVALMEKETSYLQTEAKQHEEQVISLESSLQTTNGLMAQLRQKVKVGMSEKASWRKKEAMYEKRTSDLKDELHDLKDEYKRIKTTSAGENKQAKSQVVALQTRLQELVKVNASLTIKARDFGKTYDSVTGPSPIIDQILQLRENHVATIKYGSSSGQFLGHEDFADFRASLIDDGYQIPSASSRSIIGAQTTKKLPPVDASDSASESRSLFGAVIYFVAQCTILCDGYDHGTFGKKEQQALKQCFAQAMDAPVDAITVVNVAAGGDQGTQVDLEVTSAGESVLSELINVKRNITDVAKAFEKLMLQVGIVVPQGFELRIVRYAEASSTKAAKGSCNSVDNRKKFVVAGANRSSQPNTDAPTPQPMSNNFVKAKEVQQTSNQEVEEQPVRTHALPLSFALRYQPVLPALLMLCFVVVVVADSEQSRGANSSGEPRPFNWPPRWRFFIFTAGTEGMRSLMFLTWLFVLLTSRCLYLQSTKGKRR